MFAICLHYQARVLFIYIRFIIKWIVRCYWGFEVNNAQGWQNRKRSKICINFNKELSIFSAIWMEKIGPTSFFLYLMHNYFHVRFMTAQIARKIKILPTRILTFLLNSFLGSILFWPPSLKSFFCHSHSSLHQRLEGVGGAGKSDVRVRRSILCSHSHMILLQSQPKKM